MRGRDERRAVLFGILLGAASGGMIALLYHRQGQQRRQQGAKPIQTKQLVRLGVALMPAMRQFLELFG